MTEPLHEGRAPRPVPAPEGQETLLPVADAGRSIVGRLHARAGDTEQAAAETNVTGKRTQRVRVLELFERERETRRRFGPNEYSGYTDYELANVLELRRPHVAGTRREELIRDGHAIRDSGMRRATDSGRPAIVWWLL